MSTILVRGEKLYNHFHNDKFPKDNFDEITIVEHDKAMTPHISSNYITS